MLPVVKQRTKIHKFSMPETRAFRNGVGDYTVKFQKINGWEKLNKRCCIYAGKCGG